MTHVRKPVSHGLIAAADAPSDLIENGDRIEYQHSAIVQSYGALLVLEAATLRVIQTTANLGVITGIGVDAALGGPVGGVLDWASAGRVLGAMDEEGTVRVLSGVRSVDGRELIARCQWAGETALVELEPRETGADLDPARLWQGLDGFSSGVVARGTLARTAAGIADGLRELIGCDRCMVYRFDPDWNGEVIAESRSDAARDSFLGMSFPTADIPRSARAMLASCRVRMTADQEADPSDLVPRLDPRTGLDLDLTPVRCRAAVGPCRRYYNNMGVRSTLVMPVFVSGRLWGLFACHHGARCRASALTDAPLAIARQIGESAIVQYLLEERAASERKAVDLHGVVSGYRPTDAGWMDRLNEQVTGFRQLVRGDGFVLRVGGVIHRDGVTPDAAGIDRLFGALIPAAGGTILTTNRLPSEHPELADLRGVACGALVVPMPLHPGDGAIWLRREQPDMVNWAGDPEEGILWNEAGRPVLTPRASFELWRTSTALTARSWNDFERHVAGSAAANMGLILASWHATQANQSKDEFLANMSHEIRTPMTAILGFVGLMAEGETDPERLAHLGTIERNAKHLLAILNDILDLSKIEAGRLVFENTPTDVGALLEECRELVAPLAEAKGVALRVERGQGDASPINTDPVRLRQVMLNLVGNAIKFTDTGSVTMGVDAPGPGGARRVWVRDTGIGMTPEQAQRVLEPFEQADASTTRKYGGTGLGLTICGRLVARLGGDFVIESAPAVGTTVSFRVDDAGAVSTPVSASAFGSGRGSGHVSGDVSGHVSGDVSGHASGDGSGSESGTVAVSPVKPGGPVRAEALRGVRVLVVEDGPDNQKLIKHYLTRAGAVVDLASDGREAVDRVTEAAVAGRAYRLVLMDMQMPVMDGYAATRTLRERGVTTPVIALTAHTMEGNREKCLGAGCTDFQAKPIVPAELIGCCVAWLGREHGAVTVV